MRKIMCSFALLVGAMAMMSGRPEKKTTENDGLEYAGVAFYNQENLFDTIHDEGKNDQEFLPDGRYRWGSVQYKHKIANMAKVLADLCTDRVKEGAAFIGMAEVENKNVLNDLIKQPALAKKGFKYIHYEGDDERGVDVACIYNPSLFVPTKSKLISVTEQYKAFSGGFITRGVLHVEGRLKGEPFHFLVNHWPSRGAESASREWMGRFVRNVVDSIRRVYPNARVVIMGDFNDDPENVSVTRALGTDTIAKPKKSLGLYNPWYETLYGKREGTLLWDGKWNLFDQIIITSNLLKKSRSHFSFFKNEIFKHDYIVAKSGRQKGGPLRTHLRGEWQDGYSDHFPTQVYFARKAKAKR